MLGEMAGMTSEKDHLLGRKRPPPPASLYALPFPIRSYPVLRAEEMLSNDDQRMIHLSLIGISLSLSLFFYVRRPRCSLDGFRGLRGQIG